MSPSLARPARLAGLRILAALCICLHPAWSVAGLVWEKTTDAFQCSVSQDVHVSKYPFVNKGPAAVTIQEIKTTCGCTTAALPKKTYLPGERDEVVVSFLLRGRRGVQSKEILVRTDDPASNATLTVSGTIEEIANVKPIFLLWRKGAPADWKTSRIEMRGSHPAHIVEVKASSQAFEVALSETDRGRSYELRVRPKDGTALGQTCVVEMKTDAAGGSQSLYVHARIK